MVAGLRKEEEEKISGGKKKEPERWEEFELVEKKALTKRISSFVLQAVGKGPGEELDPGAFVRLKLPNGLIRPYSIVGGVELGIALEEESRGGSRFARNFAARR
jgi:ferredoxin-NADP reductase